MAGTNIIQSRSRLVADPLRNFKFQVELYPSNRPLQQSLGKLGFTSVDGLNMSTEMIPYREGGWNTNPHKMPGMTDFSPVTLSSGVFYTKPGMWDAARQMFSVQWGGGTLGLTDEYRFDALIRVFDHPVTKGVGASVNNDPNGAVLMYQLYNCWVANVAFSGLNAMDNAILVSQLTLHHEGLATYFGPSAVSQMRETSV
jgi:phage tail-like protein